MMKSLKADKSPSFQFETDFTLTQDYRTGIINSWHSHNLAGA